VIIYWSMKHRQGGRNMIPTCAWSILILRGVSRPIILPMPQKYCTEDGRCVSRYLQHPCACASIFSYFHILRPQYIRKKRYISPNLGPKACMFTNGCCWVLVALRPAPIPPCFTSGPPGASCVPRVPSGPSGVSPSIPPCVLRCPWCLLDPKVV
jgi:hypothetical protein